MPGAHRGLPEGRRAMPRRTRGRRTAALVAVGAATFSLGVAALMAVIDFPRGLLILLCGLMAAAGSWEGVLRRGWARAASLALAVLAFGGGIVLLADEGFLTSLLLLGLG